MARTLPGTHHHRKIQQKGNLIEAAISFSCFVQNWLHSTGFHSNYEILNLEQHIQLPLQVVVSTLNTVKPPEWLLSNHKCRTLNSHHHFKQSSISPFALWCCKPWWKLLDKPQTIGKSCTIGVFSQAFSTGSCGTK